MFVSVLELALVSVSPTAFRHVRDGAAARSHCVGRARDGDVQLEGTGVEAFDLWVVAVVPPSDPASAQAPGYGLVLGALQTLEAGGALAC